MSSSPVITKLRLSGFALLLATAAAIIFRDAIFQASSPSEEKDVVSSDQQQIPHEVQKPESRHSKDPALTSQESRSPSEILSDPQTSVMERLRACESLATQGDTAAMQAMFSAISRESDPTLKARMAAALDLLVNPEGIEAITSLVVATGDPVILRPVEDCLARCGREDTVAYLSELHRESKDDPAASGRIEEMLAGLKNPLALPALSALLQPHTDPGFFRAAALALSKSPHGEAARFLVQASDRTLSDAQRAILRNFILATVEDSHIPIFTDAADETDDPFWRETFHQALDHHRRQKELVTGPAE